MSERDSGRDGKPVAMVFDGWGYTPLDLGDRPAANLNRAPQPRPVPREQAPGNDAAQARRAAS